MLAKDGGLLSCLHTLNYLNTTEPVSRNQCLVCSARVGICCIILPSSAWYSNKLYLLDCCSVMPNYHSRLPMLDEIMLLRAPTLES